MATTPAPEPIDALAFLEERIVKTVDVISELRQEREIIMKDLEAAIASRVAAEQELARVLVENEALRTEQKTVKLRIQKVLGQLDLLNNV